MLRQYQELKQQHPGRSFFRLGDFYELFFDDAIVGSRELQITLTARHKEHGDPIPMCGVPHHAAANYIARLVRRGFRVAICEQTEAASKTKKLVRREVVRIVTPGTPIDPQLLEARESVFLAAICGAGDTMGAAFLDISTGEFLATQETGPDAWERICADLESYAPRELLFPASLAPLINSGPSRKSQTARLPLAPQSKSDSATNSSIVESSRSSSDPVNEQQFGATLTPLDDWHWQKEECEALLRKQFGVRSLEGYGIQRKTEAIRAARCLRYAQEKQRAAASHVNRSGHSNRKTTGLDLYGSNLESLNLRKTAALCSTFSTDSVTGRAPSAPMAARRRLKRGEVLEAIGGGGRARSSQRRRQRGRCQRSCGFRESDGKDNLSSVTRGPECHAGSLTGLYRQLLVTPIFLRKC